MIQRRIGPAVAAVLALGAVGLVSPAPAARAATPPPTLPENCSQPSIGAMVSCVYAPTGAEQTFSIPSFATLLTVTAIGAAGGNSGRLTGPAGQGAQVTQTVGVTAGSQLYVEVGGTGVAGPVFDAPAGGGGFNGGGAGGAGVDPSDPSDGAAGGSGGGGASDVRTLSAGAAGSLSSRLVVAAGGGGAGGSYSRASGGDAGSPGHAFYNGQNGGGAASATMGGSGGIDMYIPSATGGIGTTGSGGMGGTNATESQAGGGGGGGGVFGGGGGSDDAGGGGGSSTGTPTVTSAPASVTISYTPGPASYLTLTPAQSSQPVVTGSQTYQAITYDSSGASVADVTSGNLSASAGATCMATSCSPLRLGDHTITASSGTLTATAVLTGTVGPPQSLTATDPSAATAGTPVTLVVTAVDIVGDRSAYTGTVHFTSTDVKAVLPADYTFTAGDAGSHTFPVTLETAGSQTVTATDTATATLTGTTGGTTVSPGPVASLTVSPASASVVAGSSQAYAATGADAYGNSVGDVTAATMFAIMPDGSCADATCAPAAAGPHTVTGTDGSAVGTASLTVTPRPTTGLVASGPAAATAGTPVSVTVTASDAAGVSATYTGTVHFTSTDAKAVLPADYTFTAGDAGSHTFPVTLETAGSQTVTATDTTTATLMSTTATTTVSPGSAASLALSPAKASVPAGSPQAYTATGSDAYGNPLGDVTAATRFAISPDGSCAGATCTPTAAGAHTVTGTDGAATSTAELDVPAAPVPSPMPTPAPNPPSTSAPIQPVIALPVLTIHAASKTIDYGKTTKLTGTVTRSGVPVAGASVQLTETYVGDHAKSLARVTTRADGTWSYTTRPAYTGVIKAASLGAAATTTVAVRLVISKVTSRVTGHTVMMTVQLGPGFTATKTLSAAVVVTDAHGHRRTVLARRTASSRSDARFTNHGHNTVVVTLVLPTGGYHLAVTIAGAPASAPGTSRTVTAHVV